LAKGVLSTAVAPDSSATAYCRGDGRARHRQVCRDPKVLTTGAVQHADAVITSGRGALIVALIPAAEERR